MLTPSELVWGVEEIEFERNSYLVQSKSLASAKYKVCLDDFGFNGSCTCERFLKWGLLQKLEAGHSPSDKLECTHIKQAKRFYCYTKLMTEQDSKAQVIAELKRLISLLGTHRTMWEKTNSLEILPSYGQCGLMQMDLEKCCEMIAGNNV